MRTSLAILLALVAGGCRLDGGEARLPPGGADAGTPEVTASCLLRDPVQVGRCLDSAGAPCQDAPGEVAHFAALAEGESLPWPQAPQAPVVSLALRATGMPVGTAPEVDAVVTGNGGAPVAHYQGPLPFSGDARSADSAVLRIVIDPHAVGQMLRATVALEDAAHDRRCGSKHFVVTAGAAP